MVGGVVKQVYKITYPNGKIYVGKDSIGSYGYFGSPNTALVNEDFEKLPEEARKTYTIRKEILWESADCTESELRVKEREFIQGLRSNDPSIGYNLWPRFNKEQMCHRNTEGTEDSETPTGDSTL